MANFEQRILEKLDKVGASLVAMPWENRNVYGNWLAQTYFFVRYSTRFLLLVGGRLNPDETRLHMRFIQHANEEKGHEKMLMTDLQNLGMKISQFSELCSTSGFYQSQFYWIEHVEPLSFFGYIILLEGIAAKFGALAFEKTEKTHGVKASNFMKVHAQEDPDHLEKALKEIASLDEKTVQHIEKNFNQAADLYAMMLKQICNQSLSLDFGNSGKVTAMPGVKRTA